LKSAKAARTATSSPKTRWVVSRGAQLGVVHRRQVVEHQRAGMDHLDRAGQVADRRPPLAGLRHRQGEDRAQPLPGAVGE
jgi:hypothetical protein